MKQEAAGGDEASIFPPEIRRLLVIICSSAAEVLTGDAFQNHVMTWLVGEAGILGAVCYSVFIQ